MVASEEPCLASNELRKWKIISFCPFPITLHVYMKNELTTSLNNLLTTQHRVS
uniref:Uncharacterized protein n=1 Tax=Rhizophora mucronata TaxID=61149 RepID=A0A2P2Q543_RHIMU